MADTQGVWLDKVTGRVVRTAPERGRQLVAPGHEPTRAQLDTIERFKANYATTTTVDETPEPAPVPARVKRHRKS